MADRSHDDGGRSLFGELSPTGFESGRSTGTVPAPQEWNFGGSGIRSPRRSRGKILAAIGVVLALMLGSFFYLSLNRSPASRA